MMTLAKSMKTKIMATMNVILKIIDRTDRQTNRKTDGEKIYYLTYM
jgi:hypothetical protein